ncbi:MAG: helix-turn-helix domain-containing protein [Bacteroidota bacterium]|nr:helix-turn-helix domain-containing protein [Bacteroidota bacterium]
MKSIVDYYQLIKIKEPVMLRTLPNGRLDSWINFTGSFYFFDEKSERFKRAPQNGFFPLSSKSTIIKIEEELVCLNIKFFPHVLLYGDINKVLTSKQPVSFNKVFDTDIKESVYEIFPQKENIGLIIAETEEFFNGRLTGSNKERIFLQYILQRIENDEIDFVSVKWLAKEFNVTEKTLQRTFIKQVGLTPKLFSKIVRFQKAVRDIRSITDVSSATRLNMSLANGYYDQSHFRKDSRKITGLTPKLLFKNLLPGFPDLMALE